MCHRVGVNALLTFEMGDENRSLLGLLNGVVRHGYYDDKDITMEFLKSELYSNTSDEEFNLLVSKAKGILKVCISRDVSDNIVLFAFLF